MDLTQPHFLFFIAQWSKQIIGQIQTQEGKKQTSSFSWCCQVASVVSDPVRPHRRQPTRLPCPWDSPGKNTAVGCHFLLQCMKVKNESEVAQSCLTLSDPMDCSLPGSSVSGIFQARVLEWGAIAFSISWCSTTELSAFLILLTMSSFACTFFQVFIQMSPLQRAQFWPYTQNTFYFLNIILMFLIQTVHCISYMLICLFSPSLWLERCVLFVHCSLFPKIIPDTDEGIQHFVKWMNE